MPEFSQTELCQVAHQARAEYNEIVGKCYEICHTFGNILIDLGLPYTDNHAYNVFQVRVGENGEEPHYLLELDTNYYVNDDKYCIVDASIDQFNDKNKNKGLVDVSFGNKSNIENVKIYHKPPSQIEIYQTVSNFLDEK